MNLPRFDGQWEVHNDGEKEAQVAPIIAYDESLKERPGIP
jgi:hypothetical protein